MILKRKLTVIKVAELQPGSDQTILDVKNLGFLKERFSRIFEAPNAYFGVEGNLVFRVKKKSFGPKVLKAESLAYEPSTTVIHTSFEALSEIAQKYSAEIFELADSYALVYPGLIWLARKEKVQT